MRGFLNIGNTCYFNTALQCLLHIPVLTNYIIRHPYDGECEFTKMYYDVTKIYWTEGKEILTINSLLKLFQSEFPRFKLEEQHDVQEAILCIIDILERAIPLIKKWFYGRKVQETIWPGGKSTNEEDFSVHLITSRGTDMEEMLKKSTDWDVLDNFEDTEGKVHNVATTRKLFSKLPQILMISFDRKSHVKIIENILMDKYEYNLIASAVHVGLQNDGHYVGFVKRRNKWYYVNDDKITQQDLPEEAGHYFMVYNLKN
jgi:ubiquitin C-terminal hydrolase|tara:strand:+ start:6828 stop:7601 length:774 start_codon:yes stop_codon:yes gene_type:complete